MGPAGRDTPTFCRLEERMSAMDHAIATRLQSQLVDFALAELVRQHRDSFPPLWTKDSWAKLLIWMALNCGVSGEREGLELFAESLGPKLTARLRRIFFERLLEDPGLQVIADPAESAVLVMPMGSDAALLPEQIAAAMDALALTERIVSAQSSWTVLDSVVAIPWRQPE
ncbi:MAG: protein phosphatase [Prochlorococcus sp.]